MRARGTLKGAVEGGGGVLVFAEGALEPGGHDSSSSGSRRLKEVATVRSSSNS